MSVCCSSRRLTSSLSYLLSYLPHLSSSFFDLIQLVVDKWTSLFSYYISLTNITLFSLKVPVLTYLLTTDFDW